MANKYHGQVQASAVHTGRQSKGADSASMTEKPGFPSAQLPGGSQPKDRSNGVKRCSTHPNSKGI